MLCREVTASHIGQQVIVLPADRCAYQEQLTIPLHEHFSREAGGQSWMGVMRRIPEYTVPRFRRARAIVCGHSAPVTQ